MTATPDPPTYEDASDWLRFLQSEVLPLSGSERAVAVTLRWQSTEGYPREESIKLPPVLASLFGRQLQAQAEEIMEGRTSGG